MANALRTRKRIHGIRRAPDGSAFEKCDYCGVMVAIALSDMHECEYKGRDKRLKGADANCHVEGQIIRDQPRSAFRFFMEHFTKTCKSMDSITIDRIGFHTWKNMTTKERHPYKIQAEKVNSAYQKVVLEEIDNISEVDDEADSAMVGKFDPDYDDCSFDSFESYERDMLGSWIT
ncbi:HMG-box (high mobility group) DNA-binding family protein [Tasmannia lanceolata]|uniref:HMG-box (high mobility group) DNA-binding family protein n=1 Tax=Tasmannia lanceolata TaxID=3420 RepID=UPI004062EF1F